MKYFVIASILFLAGACTGSDLLNSPNDTTDKIEVTGYLDSSKIKTTTSSPLNSSSEVLVTIIGIKDAATPLKELSATNERSATSNTTTVGNDGSFVVAIPALLGDTINLIVDGAEGSTPVDTDTWDDQPEFPEISEDGIQVERAEESPDYGFIGLQLIMPIESGFLEVINITNDHFALLANAHGPEGGLDEENEEDLGDESGLPPDASFYSTHISAEPSDIIFIIHNDEGVISDAIELVAPDFL